MKLAIGWFNKVVEGLLRSDNYQVTKYLAPNLVISATRRWKPRAKDWTCEMVLKVGRPNYKQRQFIKLCKRAGEPFPVKRIQFRPWPRKRA